MVNMTYFKHDIDTFYDDKVLKMFNRYEFTGYGIFMRLIEILYASKEHKLPFEGEDFHIFCKMNHLPEKETKDIITGFDLFTLDGEMFHSGRVDASVKDLRKTIQKRKAAGRKAGLASAKARQKQTPKERPVQRNSTDGQQDKIRLDKIRLDKNISEVLDFFNEETDSNIITKRESNRTKVRARLLEGFSVEDCKKVVRTKNKEWKDNPDMMKYIRIETLFSNKFEGYLNQKEVKPKTGIRRFMKDD